MTEANQELGKLNKDELKTAVKQAAKEWLDEQLDRFGRWTLRTLAAFIFVGILVVIIKIGR